MQGSRRAGVVPRGAQAVTNRGTASRLDSMARPKLGEVMSVQSTQNESTAKPINLLAIGGLVMAAVAAAGLFLAGLGVVAVFAVGAGHVALNQIKQRGERGRGLALAALYIGYAIATFALVSSIYFAVSFTT